jgi:Mor family transcriptional regulator
MDEGLLRHVAERHPGEIMSPYDVLVARHGFDVVLTLAEQVGGCTVYVPRLRTIFARCLEKEAILEYNGFNSRVVAGKYGFTDRHFRRRLGEK